MRDPIENVTRLQKQLNNLQLENQVLKNILDKAGLSYQNELASIRKTDTKEDFDPEQGKRIVHPKEITDRMAKLFFSFFWGRTDVYAKRNVNKNGEAAYYPQCDNFWSDNCHRKLNTHIDCKECKYCSYTRLDLSTILMHLRGNSYAAKDVIGVYPLFSDGTCRFLVYFRFLKILIIVPLGAIACSTMAGNRMVSHTMATYCKYFLSCVFEAVTMALAIVVCNAFINAGLPAFTGSYADWAQTLIYLCEMTFTIAMTVGSVKGAQTLTSKAFGL